MESRSFLIVPESGVPCQLDPVRFTPVQERRPSRVTGSSHGSCAFALFLLEVGFPVGNYKSSAFGVSMSAVAASAAPLVHVQVGASDGGVREGVIPCDGTRLKIVARRAGVPAEQALATGDLVHGRRMDHVLTFPWGVR